MRICIVHPASGAYSETFIRAHIERLPAEQMKTWGWVPQYHRALLPELLRRPHRPGDLKFPLLLLLDQVKKASLRTALHLIRPDAVLAEYGPSGVAVAPFCRAAGVPLIVHFHGHDAYRHATIQEFVSGYKDMFQTARAVIAVSRPMVDRLQELGAPGDKIHYNPCGVDPELFQAGDPGQAPPWFVAVGRFVDIKAPHLTLLAFKLVHEDCPEARLIMIGDGVLLESCRQMAAALNLDRAVEFTGSLPHPEVAAAMRRARALVQHSARTSLVDSEGTPVAVLEAGCSGLPVVATRHGGIRDVVIENETGFLVEERDVRSMADAMLRLARDPRLAAEMGRKARERVIENFSMTRSIGRLWQIIQDAVRESGRKSSAA